MTISERLCDLREAQALAGLGARTTEPLRHRDDAGIALHVRLATFALAMLAPLPVACASLYNGDSAQELSH